MTIRRQKKCKLTLVCHYSQCRQDIWADQSRLLSVLIQGQQVLFDASKYCTESVKGYRRLFLNEFWWTLFEPRRSVWAVDVTVRAVAQTFKLRYYQDRRSFCTACQSQEVLLFSPRPQTSDRCLMLFAVEKSQGRALHCFWHDNVNHIRITSGALTKQQSAMMYGIKKTVRQNAWN